MTNSKSTKSALFTSSIALLLCFAMLVGTTFAWFTDSVTSSSNRIMSGNLDVDILMDKIGDGNYVSIANGEGDIFSEATGNGINWEPGKTEIVYLAVQNTGSLALKYNIILDIVDQGLIGSLEYALVDGAKASDLSGAEKWADVKAVAQTGDVEEGRTIAAKNGALLGGENATDYFALAVHMKEEAGNEYQNKSIKIDVCVAATQLTAEDDSFGNQYDADANLEMPKLPAQKVTVASADEFAAALSNVTGETIIDATGVNIEITEVMANGSAAAYELPAGVTIKGATFVPTHRGGNYIMMSAGANEQVVFDSCNFPVDGKNLVIGSEVDGPDSVIYNNCTFTGSVITNFVDNPDGVAEFNGCIFKKATSGNISRSFVEGMGGTHNFNNCTFDYTGITQSSMGVISSGCVNVYSESEYSTTVVLNGCTRINCGTRTYGPNSSLIIK